MCGLVWRCTGGVYWECWLCVDLLRTHVLNDVCVAKWSCDSRMQTYGTAALSVVPVAYLVMAVYLGSPKFTLSLSCREGLPSP